MEKRQIVCRLFIPPNKQAAKTIHPGMCSFHYPAACLKPSLLFDGLGFFPTRTNMGGKAKVVEDVAYFLVIVAFIQAHPLWFCLRRFRSVYHDLRDVRALQCRVIPLVSSNPHANGYT